MKSTEKFLSTRFVLTLGLGLTASSFSTLVHAQTPAVTSSAPWTSDMLENGLEVITMPAPKVPLVTIVLVSKAGAMTETPDISGLTHLWEHMFFKGNARLPNQEAFHRRVRQLGISYNGDTSAEKVRYYFTLPSVFLDEGMQFMADAISTPLLEEKELQRERVVVLDEYDRNASNPGFDRYDLERSIVYGDKAYLRDPLGVRTIIEKATREQLLTIRDRVFVPSNCALVVVGDVDPKKAKALAQKHFATWRNPKDWKPFSSPDFPAFPETTDFIMTRPHLENAAVDITFSGPRVRNNPKDSYPADMLVTLVGHRSGKFYKKFVDSGLTFTAGFGFHTQSQTGELQLFAETKAENVAKAKADLLAEIPEFGKEGYFSESQLEDVKRSLAIDRKKEMNQPSEYAKHLAFWWAVTGLTYYDTYLENLRKVTLADVRDFVQRYLIGKSYVTSILLSPENAKKANLTDNSAPLMAKYFPDRAKEQAKR